MKLINFYKEIEVVFIKDGCVGIDKIIEIGRDYWSKGITSEALSAVMTFLFEEVDVHRIFAKHDVENPASGKVMQKCSMIYEGRLREHYLRHDGTYSDALVYSILSNEHLG